MGRGLYRLGRFTSHHRWPTVGVWLALVAISVVSVRMVGAKTNSSLTLPGTDSQAAFDLLAAKFPPQQNGTNPFVFHVDHGKLTDPANKAALDATYKLIAASPYVYSVRNPVGQNASAEGIISKDERTGLMPVLLNVGSGFITDELATKVFAATKPAQDAGITVAVGGSIGNALSKPDTQASEALGNISAMVILAIVFGSLVAMGLPIVSAAFGLAITTSVIGILGHVVSVPGVAPTLAVMIGLGVGIDYALFLMTKHKEQLATGMDLRESIALSVSSSGSAVVFAGGTVVIALASLAAAGIPLVTMLGLSAAIAVFVAVLTSITLLPAILSLVGSGVERLRIPRFLRPTPAPEGHRRWDAWARWVTSHRLLAVGIALAILIPLLVPLFTLELGQPDVGVTPTSTTQRQAYDLMTAGFGVGYNGPLLIAMSLDPAATPSTEYTQKYDQATALQKQLEDEQKQLEARQAKLERRQAALKKQQRELEREAATLRRQKASLQRQAAALEAQKRKLASQANALEVEGRALARQIAPLAARLAAIKARERVLERRIAHTIDPIKRAELEARLAIVQQREAAVRAQLRPLLAQGRVLVQQGRSLAAQAQQLRVEAAALQRQENVLLQRAAELQKQKAQLERQAAALQASARRLRADANAAKQQKQVALNLQSELTAMLTKAGGDPRGTDPRVVATQDAVAGTSGVSKGSPVQVNKSGDAVIMSAIPKDAPSSDATAQLVTVLRSSVLPPLTRGTGEVAHVGGTTATYVDLARKIAARMPVVILVVLSLSFIFLLVAFRSLLVPLQAAVTNLLSVGAALGVLTVVFQWGWGLSAIGLETPSGTVPIASYVPLMMFAVLFGLSMDYEVFLVSRIVQHHERGEDPRSAVTSGLGAAALVVTSAALIMLLVFSSFIINGDPTIKQFGVGLAVAVLLAGTMVVLLAPALLSLFGAALFKVPAVVDRLLPHLDVEGADVVVVGEPEPHPADLEPARRDG